MSEMIVKRHNVLFDEEDRDLLNEYTWFINFESKTGKPYVRARIRKSKLYITMHRLVMGAATKELVVDHKNNDGLDNRKENLRFASLYENARNVGPQKNNKTGFKGVVKVPTGKFCAKIYANEKSFHLGTFLTPEQAALAYDNAARSLHGDFAFLNFP